MRRLLILLWAASSSFAQPNASSIPGTVFDQRQIVKTFPASGALRFEITELLEHPFYWWPRTLVTYPVRFDQSHVAPDALTLTRADTGARIPLQLSGVKSENGQLRFAFVNFFTDLPSGAHRVFELSTASAPRATQQTEPAVRESRDGDSIILDTGAMQVRIPASRAIVGESPGPILQIARGGPWFGQSRIVSRARRVLDLTTTRTESGTLLVSYQMRYRFAGGGTYTATVRAISGYDFVSFYEEMEGIAAQDAIHLETSWTGFHPTHRQAPNHPYYPRLPNNGKHGYSRFEFETIDQDFVSTQHGVSGGKSTEGEMPFRLGIYEPWGAYVTLTSANFWDARSNDALAIFIDKTARWQDHDYAIWSASPTLQIRYYYNNSVLFWRWPLSTGTRSTALAAYDHQKDIDAVDLLEELSKPHRDNSNGLTYSSELFPASHALFLQNRYGTLDLNVVKDWVLEYPENGRHPPVIFQTGVIPSADALESTVFRGELVRGLAISGTRQNGAYNPVASRTIYESWIDAYNRFYASMNPRQKRRLTAWYLLMAYVDAGDELMPVRTMLSGHPNFLSDIKSVPAQMAFLFPDHPMAREWADGFAKFVELNTRYHTRPAVPSWESSGGRWTENLGTYVWAFLRPAIRAELALQKYFDGENRFAVPPLAQLGEWVVNALSAPFDGEDPKYSLGPDGKLARHAWGLVTPALAPRRLDPPQGAHSARRMAPRSMWLLGDVLRNYQPLIAEYLMWEARPGDDDSEHFKEELDSWSILYPAKDNHGTNPHLQSSKFTGYGIVLRAAVDTRDELSVHLQQIDEGPNYRWGIAGEGGNGVIYYYAGGKSYSHNDREDVGDRAAHDTDFCTNFGVWKNGQFRSIGRNVLDRPLYDLHAAQFAEAVPREGPGSYSWPEYVSRSIMLVGSDYFVIYDRVFNDSVAHRFSWFTHIADELPFIYMVKGGVREGRRLKTTVQTEYTKGVWYDGMGDAMAVVSHKQGLQVATTPFGARVTQPTVTDLIFRNPAGIDYSAGGVSFHGTAGVVRSRAGGAWEVTVFHGTRAAAGGLEVSLEHSDLGISATFQKPSEATGIYFARKEGILRLACAECLTGHLGFYVDGAPLSIQAETAGLRLLLPAGRHRWQLTAGGPLPNPPRILRTANRSGASEVVIAPVAGATRYRVELSADGGATWRALATISEPRYLLAGLENGVKIHVRAIAVNGVQSSEPGPEYPIYATAAAPPPPDGLKLNLSARHVVATWGEVLGVGEYRLYRRLKGQAGFTMICQGLLHECADNPSGVRAPFEQPGIAENALYSGAPFTVYEYAVSAVNGNGEGAKSALRDTNPASWANWDPKPGEPFRRRVVHNTLPPDSREGMPSYYPK